MAMQVGQQMSTEELKRCLHQVGEHFAAGYLSAPQEPTVVRFALGVAELWSHMELPEHQGEGMYPCGRGWYWHGMAAELHYSGGLQYDAGRLQAKLETAEDEKLRAALGHMHEALRDLPPIGGYTHSIPNYRRILTEGLNSYERRIEAARQKSEARGEQERVDFCRAMRIVLDALRGLVARSVARVREAGDETLAAMLEHAPLEPARSFREGLAATNFVLYVDGPDDLGRFDQDLWPLYQQDRAAGRVQPEEALKLIRQVWRNVDVNEAWNVALGGLLEDGTSGVNELTHLCVKAAEGMRRPNLALRLHRTAPDSIWETALDCISHGSGIPALYNEEAYVAAIRDTHLGVSEADLPDFAFGGCTELMIHGKSNCGSLEGDINLPLVLVDSLQRHLAAAESFETFLAAYKADLSRVVRGLVDSWNANQESKARHHPQVIRSLLIDDCIDNAREYNAGGARYNWCVVNVMGLANVIDSLAAVRETIYGEDPVEAQALLAALRSDFDGYGELKARLEGCPRFGNDDPRADDLARDISDYVFRELRMYSPWRGGRYVPACLMFVTYAWFGKPVGATPDGRRAGEPIADSAGAMQGRDTSGPTALLGSVASIRHNLAPGTLVVNARFSRKYFDEPETRAKLKALIKGYFQMGGMQLQVNVVDQKVLRDAYEHPERHGDLIIRMGGYSEYWTRLDDDLRRSVLERIEHE